MPIFRRKGAKILKKGTGDQTIEERVTKTVAGEEVTIRRVRTVSDDTKPKPKSKSRDRKDRRPRRDSRKAGRGQQQQQRQREEPVEPPESSARKQMLMRTLPHQTQIVVLEGPVLVEHYVARSDKVSLIGNVYLGKVRNVLPGMEAAFVDFGEGKNGVLYAGDVGPSSNGKGRSRIEQALKVGDEIIVQVTKDPMGHKGARLTGEVSLAGRYLVLSPGADVRGISRRLDDAERDRLRKLVSGMRPDGFGIIVRTAAEDATEEDLRADVDRLKESWDAIQNKAKGGNAPRLLYEEPPLEIRVIREHFTSDYRRLLVDGKQTYDRILGYLKKTDPDLADKAKLYSDDVPLFERFHVEDQLRKALDRKVWLPSGGHIVVDRTEALTVIDVNTGKFVGRSNLEETVLQNNLEAAEEVARQLRLRDIGGIIVIDFIDMDKPKNRQAVLKRLREHLAKDRTRTQVFDVSELGLVEMTRKNQSEGLLESFSEVCPHCNGRGVLLYEEAATVGEPMPGKAVQSKAKAG